MRLLCPYCGWRPHEEFDHAGDASVARPAEDADIAEWHAYVYLRTNPKGAYREYWQHTRGCRSWLRITRDTLTHEVTDSRLAAVEPTP